MPNMMRFTNFRGTQWNRSALTSISAHWLVMRYLMWVKCATCKRVHTLFKQTPGKEIKGEKGLVNMTSSFNPVRKRDIQPIPDRCNNMGREPSLEILRPSAHFKALICLSACAHKSHPSQNNMNK